MWHLLQPDPSALALALSRPLSLSFTFWGVFSTLFSFIELISSAVTLIFKFRSSFFFVLRMRLLDSALFLFLGVMSRVCEDIDASFLLMQLLKLSFPFFLFQVAFFFLFFNVACFGLYLPC